MNIWNEKSTLPAKPWYHHLNLILIFKSPAKVIWSKISNIKTQKPKPTSQVSLSLAHSMMLDVSLIRKHVQSEAKRISIKGQS